MSIQGTPVRFNAKVQQVYIYPVQKSQLPNFFLQQKHRHYRHQRRVLTTPQYSKQSFII